jgi:hypothetical protein
MCFPTTEYEAAHPKFLPSKEKSISYALTGTVGRFIRTFHQVDTVS